MFRRLLPLPLLAASLLLGAAEAHAQAASCAGKLQLGAVQARIVAKEGPQAGLLEYNINVTNLTGATVAYRMYLEGAVPNLFNPVQRTVARSVAGGATQAVRLGNSRGMNPSLSAIAQAVRVECP